MEDYLNQKSVKKKKVFVECHYGENVTLGLQL